MPLLDASFPGAGVTFGLQLFARKARFTLAPCVIVKRRAVVSVVFRSHRTIPWDILSAR